MTPSAYSTQATAVGGRHSAVASVDGSLKAQLRDDEGGSGTNAEQLLASALAASFLKGLKITAAEQGHVLTPDANVTVTVCLEGEGEAAVVSAVIDVDLPGVHRDTTLALATEARKTCPYAQLLPGHVRIQVSVL